MDIIDVNSKKDLLEYCSVVVNISPSNLFPLPSPLPQRVKMIRQSEDGIVKLVYIKDENAQELSYVEFLIFVCDMVVGFSFVNGDLIEVIPCDMVRCESYEIDNVITMLFFTFRSMPVSQLIRWLENDYINRSKIVCVPKKIVW